MIKTVIFLCAFYSFSLFAAGLLEPKELYVRSPDNWNRERQERFAAKIDRINGLGFFPSDMGLLPRELLLIVEQANLGPHWLAMNDVMLTSDQIVSQSLSVYKGMKDISPEVLGFIFENGIDCPILFRHRLGLHVDDVPFATLNIAIHSGVGSAASIFISTSTDRSVAEKFADNTGYVLLIELPANTSISVNDALGAKHSYAHENEIVVPFKLPSAYIRGAYKAAGNDTGIVIIENPNFVGRL